jgi:hypothetical protein
MLDVVASLTFLIGITITIVLGIALFRNRRNVNFVLNWGKIVFWLIYFAVFQGVSLFLLFLVGFDRYLLAWPLLYIALMALFIHFFPKKRFAPSEKWMVVFPVCPGIVFHVINKTCAR